MPFESKRIDVNEFNAKIFTERYGSSMSCTAFTNQLLEKYFSGRLVEIDDHNYKVMRALSEKINNSIEKTVNLALESVDWSPDETPKPRITLDTGSKKVKPQKKVKQGINIIKDF